MIRPNQKQTHYLLHVLRLSESAEILLFNGRDGEWRAALTETNKRSTHLICLENTRPQTPHPQLELLFAPLKVGRMDYLIQKAVEMGVDIAYTNRIYTKIAAFQRINLWLMQKKPLSNAVF